MNPPTLTLKVKLLNWFNGRLHIEKMREIFLVIKGQLKFDVEDARKLKLSILNLYFSFNDAKHDTFSRGQCSYLMASNCHNSDWYVYSRFGDCQVGATCLEAVTVYHKNVYFEVIQVLQLCLFFN